MSGIIRTDSKKRGEPKSTIWEGKKRYCLHSEEDVNPEWTKNEG